MSQLSTKELITQHIAAIAPINSTVAASLTTWVVRIAQFESSFHALEQRVIDLNTMDPAVLAADQQIIDLNQQARDDAADLLSLPLDVYGIAGTVRFASLIFGGAAVTSEKIAYEAASEAIGAAFDQFLGSIWDVVSLELLPPFEQGTNDSDLFIGNLNGGEVELLSGNDIFIPNDTGDAYLVEGGSLDDVIFGGTSGDDSLQGDSGNDTIMAANGAFQISGGDGDDWVQQEIPTDISSVGNDGADTVIGSGSDDAIFGADIPFASTSILSDTSSNVVIGRGGSDTVNGGAGNDVLVGDNISDTDGWGGFIAVLSAIEAKVNDAGVSGNDTLTGYTGDDTLLGGGGNDLLYGDDGIVGLGVQGGRDVLVGGKGNDTLHGGDDNDTLNGGDDEDMLNGDEGNDSLEGGKGSDTLNGGDGNDTVNGDDADDMLNGDDGDDSLEGGKGSDTLNGGDGNDTIYGGDDGDTLNGDEGGDALEGGSGSDSLNGGDGADTLNGGDGADTLSGGHSDGASDVLSGGSGSDTIEFSGSFGTDKVYQGEEIVVNGSVLSGEATDDDDDNVYELGSFTITQAGSGLKIAGSDGEIHLLDWSENNDYGITLEENDDDEDNEEDSEEDDEQGGGGSQRWGGYFDPLFDNPPVSPLILDLDMDGQIELSALTISSSTFFDLDADGFMEQTGWVKADDGLLAIDSNVDGVINDIDELFGNSATDGFVELAAWDSNSDGIINASDAVFADLLVWQDIDEDGYSDSKSL